jgi:hypothetical protein
MGPINQDLRHPGKRRSEGPYLVFFHNSRILAVDEGELVKVNIHARYQRSGP